MAANGVRPGGRRDLAAVVALWSELVRHHAPLDPHYRVADGAEEVWRDFLARLLREPDAAVFVQERDGAACGFVVAELARAQQIEQVTFNRNGFLYHGRVKALADAAREAGLKF